MRRNHLIASTWVSSPFLTSLLFLVLSCIPQSVFAQAWENLAPESEVSIRLFSGFSEANPVFRPDLWVPIGVEVENRSEETVKGNLVVLPLRGVANEARIRTEVPIAFAPRQRKLVRIVGRLPEWTEDLVVFFDPVSRTNPVAALGMREMDPQERLVVVLGEDTKSYRRYEKSLHDEKATRRGITVQQSQRSDLLPEVVQGYDTVTLMVWDGLKLDEPTPDQISSLNDYLNLGGTLVLALADQGNRLNVPGWSDLLGNPGGNSTAFLFQGEVKNAHEGDGSTVLTSAVKWNTAESSAESATASVHRALILAEGPFSGVPCLSVDGEPLLYRREVGAGRILISRISFHDWPLLGEAGIQFWQDLIGSLPLQALPLAPSLVPFNSYLKTSLLGELPSPWFIGGFLGLYTILAIPLNYLLFRKRKRLELAWLMLPVWAILFSWLAYHIGAIQQQGGVVEREIVVGLHPSGSTMVRGQTMAAVYSPTRRLFTPKVKSGPALPIPTVTDFFETHEAEFTYRYLPPDRAGRYHPFIPGLLVPHWASKNVAFDTAGDLGGSILIQAAPSGTGAFSVTVRNESDYDISNLALVRLAKSGELGAVPRGATREFSISEESLVPLTPPFQAQRFGSTFYGISRSFHRMGLPAFLDLYGREHVAFLPFQTSVEQGVLDSYAPSGSDRRSLYALAQIDTSVNPVGINASLFGHEAATLLLIPVGTRSEEKTFNLRPSDWIVTLSELDSQMNLNQIDRGKEWRVGEDAILSVESPLHFHGATESATFVFNYRTTLRLGRFHPVEFRVEFPAEQGESRKSPKHRLEWAFLNRAMGTWETAPAHGEIPVERLHQFWDSRKNEVGIRCVVKWEDESSRERSYERGAIVLPQLHLEGERY